MKGIQWQQNFLGDTSKEMISRSSVIDISQESNVSYNRSTKIRDDVMPTILLINDDGIRSIGLLALKKRLTKLGRILVVAPKEETSGVGKALTTRQINITETGLEDGSKAYAITGTPADAFLLAFNKIMKRSPDLLVAGINMGPNLGIDDLLNSGTLGAALEAAIHHVPAIAVSYCIPEITENQPEKMAVTEKELELTVTIAEKTAQYVLNKGMPPEVDIISINVPKDTDFNAVKITSLSYEGYGDIHSKLGNGFMIKRWMLANYPDDEMGTDLYAVKKEKSVSITPIKIRLPHNRKSLEDLLKTLATLR
jgi:5'-nucleotidase